MFLFNQNINNCYFKLLLVNKHLRAHYLLIAKRQQHQHWSPVCVSCGHFRYNNERKKRFYLSANSGAVNNQRYFSSNANNSNNTDITANNSKQNISEKEAATKAGTVARSSSGGVSGGDIVGDRIMVPVKHLHEVLTPPPDRPIAKKSGFIVIRKLNELTEWYAKTPPKRRTNIYASFGINVFICASVFVLVLTFGAWMDLKNNKFTGRECIVSMSERAEKVLEREYIAELTEKYIDKFVPTTDQRLQRLDNCFNRLMAANNDIEGIEGQPWVAALIDDNELSEVVVVGETTTVIVFSKVLEMCENDHQLAYVLSHAFAHKLLDHRKETSAHTPWYLVPLAIYMPTIYSVLSNNSFELIAMDQWILDRIKEFFKFVVTVRVLPYKEVYEQEADRIGLQLMTRACFDTRESPKFCAKHLEFSETLRRNGGLIKQSDSKKIVDKTHYLYLHPIDEYRISYLDALMQPFIDIRNELTKCEKLC